MQVIKRNRNKVDFDRQRIKRAILNAMMEAGEVDEILADSIVDDIELAVSRSVNAWTVENISDAVEMLLESAEAHKVKQFYSEYRKKRATERDGNISVDTLLTKEFLSKYKHVKPPMTQLGELVYYRTYSRFMEDKGRREEWWETVKRAVEYNCSLLPTSREEAEELYDAVFNLKMFLSGRTFWVGGTTVAEKFPMANFNCSFQIIDEFESFADLFYVLLIGSGAGVRVLQSDVDKLPKIRTDIQLIKKPLTPVIPAYREDNTSLKFYMNESAEIVVGDSKDGWVQALLYYFKLMYSKEYSNIKFIIMNYDNVRPKGERLKTFGGTASGHEVLSDMFTKIHGFICSDKSTKYRSLTATECLDIANTLGEGVVAGGVRRTAEIVLLDQDDDKSISAKANLYENVDGTWKLNSSLSHRQMSNNSIYYKEKPTRERLHWQLEQMRYSGEPAWVNEELGKKRRPNFNGVNPCVEILLDSKGLCNLTTVNVFAFVNEENQLDLNALLRVQALSARASYRMTCIELELPKWNSIQKRDRLTGCSLTGWQDMVNAVGMDNPTQASVLRMLRFRATSEAHKLATSHNLPIPLLVTTVKPEGTLSQLPTVSSGVHYSHSPYYIRRVRINANDPVLKVCEELDYVVKNEVGQTDENCTTKVVEFPVKAPKGRTKYDVSAIEQLENYKMFMENYVDHNCSITVHVREHEWEEVEQWVWDNWDSIFAVSFLALDDNFYELLPYESIDEVEYENRFNAIKDKHISTLKISKYEKREIELELSNDGCDAGVCPIR